MVLGKNGTTTGTCPWCSRDIPLDDDALMMAHGYPPDFKQQCHGSGALPQ